MMKSSGSPRLTVAATGMVTALIVGTASLGTATSAERRPADSNDNALMVVVKVVSGGNRSRTGDIQAEEWVIRVTAGLGSPHAWNRTGWVEVTNESREIYGSPRGGRIIRMRLLHRQEQGGFTVEITGFKIGNMPQRVELVHRAGARKVVKLTNYRGARNIFLALRVARSGQAQDRSRIGP